MKIDSQAGEASGENPDNEFNKIVEAGWRNLYAAIRHRDESMVTAEVQRVARGLCYTHGDQPDDLVQMGTRVPVRFGLPGTPIHQGASVMMGWAAYIGMACNAIANLEAVREEEAAKRKADEEAANVERRLRPQTLPGDMGGYQEAGAREDDELSDCDISAMVEYLATVFDFGPDGDTAICRQTGGEFKTVAVSWRWGDKNDHLAKKRIIRDATFIIIGMAGGGDGTLYWRKRPEIRSDSEGLKLYARVAFGP